DVYTGGSTPGLTENIVTFNTEIQRAASAHNQPCNASHTCFPAIRLISFDGGPPFLTDNRLAFKFYIATRIRTPAAPTPIRTNNHIFILIYEIFDMLYFVHPVGIIARIAVQQV